MKNRAAWKRVVPVRQAAGRIEEVLDYRTFGCSKAKPFWKPYWDFPLKQGQKRNVKCIYQEGMSILELCSPLASTGNPKLGFQ